MNITKIGHCCLLIEHQGAKLLTDPGTFSTGQDELQGIQAVLITHEHADHLHVDSLKRVLANNPAATVYANESVAKILQDAGLAYTVIRSGDSVNVGGVTIEALEGPHAEISPLVKPVLNTAFMIGGILFYPGDAFISPERPVDVLALPVAGPWMKLPEAIRYAAELKPRVAFPVHDGILKIPGMMSTNVKAALEQNGIEFVPMAEGDRHVF